MTKASRNRRKERRADIAKRREEVKLAISQGKFKNMLVKRTKEEILAIRNPAYEYLIP